MEREFGRLVPVLSPLHDSLVDLAVAVERGNWRAARAVADTVEAHLGALEARGVDVAGARRGAKTMREGLELENPEVAWRGLREVYHQTLLAVGRWLAGVPSHE